MLIAIVADTHLPRGKRRLPEACLERMAAADLILHAGDFVTAAVLDRIEGIGPPVKAVHGNVDEGELRARLPAEVTVNADGILIGMVHDAGQRRGRLARMRRRFPDAAAVVFGHSHLPLLEEEGDFQMFNPGSPTERRRAPRHTMGLARVAGDGLSFSHLALD